MQHNECFDIHTHMSIENDHANPVNEPLTKARDLIGFGN